MSVMTTPEQQSIEAEVVEDMLPEVSGPSGMLLRTDDPGEAVTRATDVANRLKSVIAKQKLYVDIRGKSYVRVEGWQTLGALLGVTPVCVATDPVPSPSGDEYLGWKARVEARTLDGRVIGAADSLCMRSEKRWANADDYAVMSMAQTRATSKAMRSVLAFVMSLAGYETTPAEEIAQVLENENTTALGVENSPAQNLRKISADAVQSTEPLATPAQQRLIWAKAKEKGLDEKQMREIFEDVANVAHTDRVPKGAVDPILEAIESA